MFRFVLGALVGGLAVWYWGDEIREYAETRSLEARKSAADMIRLVSKKAEDVLDQGTETVQGAGMRDVSSPSRRPQW